MQLWAKAPAAFQGRPGFDEPNADQASRSALRQLVQQSVEVVAFVLLLLVEIRLSEVAAACPPQLLERFAKLTYRDLIATDDGRKVVNELVTVVINHQISKGQSVDAISNTLEQRCGSICSKDDILLYKANEQLDKANEVQAVGQQAPLLRESLQLFTKAAQRISEERLRSIGESYRSLAFLNGASGVALTSADYRRRDRAGVAVRGRLGSAAARTVVARGRHARGGSAQTV